MRVAYADRAVRLAPESPEVLDTLGMVLLQEGDGQTAVRTLERAAANASEVNAIDATITYHLALALSATGDTEQAGLLLGKILGQERAFSERRQAEALLESLQN